MYKILIFFFPIVFVLGGHSFLCGISRFGKDYSSAKTTAPDIRTGAEQLDIYLPLLAGKKVALLVNQTSMVGKKHLLDTLISRKVIITKIFAPEHGFRGQAAAGEHVSNEVDAATGLPVISLYGKNKKPSKESLQDVDIVVFDIQDVGARFFTYISTLHYMMEACAASGIQLLVLDRPNPNGFYVDGPVLEPKFKSFLGMHPIPIVHGLTVGELAGMINGEKWLDSGMVCSLKVIKMEKYTHKIKYHLPVRPSPNLPNDQAIMLYPSICLFEGTNISLGRGTPFPFQVLGGPDKSYGTFVFTPENIPGVANHPPHEKIPCYGVDLRNAATTNELDLKYLIEFYQKAPDKEKFFIAFFNTLAGNSSLQEQIKAGWTEEKIKSSWQEDLGKYNATRKKYLLYEDF
jgi:uncharacterized protein YbbC (DUF1343 family)